MQISKNTTLRSLLQQAPILPTSTQPTGPRRAEKRKKNQVRQGAGLTKRSGLLGCLESHPGWLRSPTPVQVSRRPNRNRSTSRASVPSVLLSPFAARTRAGFSGAGSVAPLPTTSAPLSHHTHAPGGSGAQPLTNCLKTIPRSTTSPATSSSAPWPSRLDLSLSLPSSRHG